jgi:hypothetical protein
MPFFKNGEQEGKTGPVWGLRQETRQERWEYKEKVKKAECSRNIMYSCMKMEKWDLLKLVQEWGGARIKENDGGGEFNHDIL